MQICLGYAMVRRIVPMDWTRRTAAETGNFSVSETASASPGQLFAMAGTIVPMAVMSYRHLVETRTIRIVRTQDLGSVNPAK